MPRDTPPIRRPDRPDYSACTPPRERHGSYKGSYPESKLNEVIRQHIHSGVYKTGPSAVSFVPNDLIMPGSEPVHRFRCSGEGGTTGSHGDDAKRKPRMQIGDDRPTNSGNGGVVGVTSESNCKVKSMERRGKHQCRQFCEFRCGRKGRCLFIKTHPPHCFPESFGVDGGGVWETALVKR